VASGKPAKRKVRVIRVPLAHPLGEDGETAVDLVIGEYGKLGHAHLR